MELIADYLCDKVKGFVKAQSKHLVLRLKWIWDRLPKRFLYDLAVNVIANIIANLLLK